MRAGIVSCLFAMFGAVASAETPSEVVPDRPDVSNSTQTVPLAPLQIESGVKYQRSRAGRRLAVQTSARTGLSDGLEVRVDAEPLVHLRNERQDTGLGDFSFGFKYRFLDSVEGQWAPSLGVQPFVKVSGSQSPDWIDTP